jgi:putative transposase
MDKIDTLPNPNQSSSLHDLLTGPGPTPASLNTHRRRREDYVEPRVSPDNPEQDQDWANPSGVVFEPVSRPPYDLSYACLLIPRFSSHYLIGDIAEDLHEWMRQICVSFDWRLESILVRPEYMQWVIYVPAATPPSRCIRTVREQTSKLILEDFPHIKRENLSKDFWAPGYGVLLGPTPYPPDMINEFIRLTRQQQGIQPHLGR